MRICTHWLGVVLGQFWGIAEGDNGTIQDGNCGEKLSGKSWISTGKKGYKNPTELLLEDGIEIIRERAKLNLKRLEEMKGSLSIPGWFGWYGLEISFLVIFTGFCKLKMHQIGTFDSWQRVQWLGLGQRSLRIHFKIAPKLQWFLKPWMLRCLLCCLGFLLFFSPWNLMILHPGGAREDLLSLTLFSPSKMVPKNQAFQSY